MRLSAVLKTCGAERRKLRLLRNGKRTEPVWAWVFKTVDEENEKC